MEQILYAWLEERWKYDNHPKYQHYFKQWVSNITKSQIEGFSKQEKMRNVYEG